MITEKFEELEIKIRWNYLQTNIKIYMNKTDGHVANDEWRIKYNNELYELYGEPDIVTYIKIGHW